ncbi:MAG TPA: cytochrome P450 [Thermoleophilaceae bacterium]|jgi:cytochrome P450
MSREQQARHSLPPGPRIPKVIQGVLFWRRVIWFFDRCRNRYGEYFTVYAPPWGKLVVIANPADIRKIWAGDATVGDAGIAYGKIYDRAMGPRSVFVLDGDDHVRTKQLVSPALHGERVRRYHQLMTELAAAEIDSWPVGEPVRVADNTRHLTLEIILRVIFGIGEADDNEVDELRKRLPELVDPGLILQSGWALPWLERVGPWRRMRRRIDELYALLDDLIARRRAESDLEDRDDVLSHLLITRTTDGKSLSNDEVRDQLVTLLTAGHEPTSTGVAWAIERLMRHPDKLERLRSELAEGRTEYLDAVMKETLRVRPIVFGGLRKLVKDVEVGGYHLPAGIHVSPSTTGVHHDEARWDAAMEFRPERFLDGSDDDSNWIPFGGGRRRCVGAAFATAEIKAVLATFVSRAELVPVRDRPEGTRARVVTQVPARGAEAIVVRHITPASERESTAVGEPVPS